jgi:hypothetical protein
MYDGPKYGHGIDEIIEGHCGGYEAEDYVRLAMAAATEAGLGQEALDGIRLWLTTDPGASAEAVRAGLEAHDSAREDIVRRGCSGLLHGAYGSDVHPVLMAAVATPQKRLPALALAALDQADVSLAHQLSIRSLLRGAS